MRTEQLLRETLADLAGQARTPEVALGRILGGVPARPARRRGLVLVLAAIVLLALAVAVPTVLVNRTVEPVGRVPGNWNLNHRVELPPGWQVFQQTISTDSESTGFGEISPPGEGVMQCTVEVFSPGRGDPHEGRTDRVPVTVNGRPAFWAELGSAPTVAGVSWEYAPGAFALMNCGSSDPADDVAWAARVRFEPVPVRLPFRLRSLPDGYEGFTLSPMVARSDGTSPAAVIFRAYDGREAAAFELYAEPGRTEVPPGLPGWETDTIRGIPAVLSARDARLCLNTDTTTACISVIDAGEPADLTTSLWAAGRRELLVDVAERLVVAEDVDSPETWFPANRAIPG